MLRHTGEMFMLFGLFFGLPTTVQNTTMGQSDTGQGEDIAGSLQLIEQGYDRFRNYIDVTPDSAWLDPIDTPFFGTVSQVPSPMLDKDRYVSYEDNVRFPMLQIVYPTVPNFDADEAPLDALAEILGGGKSSLFYKNLVKTQQAVQANAGHPATELSGQLTMTILPYPGKKLDSTEALVRQTLAEFEKRGVTDDDIAQFRATREAQLIDGLSSVSGKVSQLAQYQTFLGNPNYLPQELKRYTSVTKADVMRVYDKYIRGKHAVILTVYPKGKPEIVSKPDNYTVSTADYRAPDYGYSSLKYAKASDSFDRSKKPGPGPNPALKVPPFWTDRLARLSSVYLRLSAVASAYSMRSFHYPTRKR